MIYTSETMLVHSKDKGATSVSAQQAGWEYLSMAARRLNTGPLDPVYLL